MAGISFRDLVSNLNRPRRGKKSNKSKKKSGVIVPSAGIGLYTSVAKASGVGISSPLTEQTINDRKYYTTATVFSSDGIFSFDFTPIKSMKFTDAAGYNLQFIFKPDPTPED